jgi:sugar/nucleoside kinase (ribokinase family)
MSFVTVGSIGIDTIATPFKKVENVLGGSASYVSFASSYFITPELVAVVGNDFSEHYITEFKHHGVDVGNLEIAEGKTFRWGGEYSQNFDIRTTLFTELNVFESFLPKLSKSAQEAQFLLLGNIHPALQIHVIEQMQSKPFIAADTMNLWIDIALGDLKVLISRINLLIINDEEALMLTGERDPAKAAKQIRAMGPSIVVIKKGQNGALLFNNNTVFWAPAMLLPDVQDPTGAGDSFAGGMLGYLAKVNNINDSSLRKAVIYGSVMASFCVEKFSVEGLLNRSIDEIEARYTSFKNLVQF